MKKICDHPTLLTKRAAVDIAEGMEGYLDNEDIAAAEAMTNTLAGIADAEDGSMGAPSCKIVFLMALLVSTPLIQSTSFHVKMVVMWF